MLSQVPVLHGGGLPHSDALGVPIWLQWLIVVLALAIAGWLVLDARGQRRSNPAPTSVETEPAKDPPERERLVRVAAPPRPKPVVVAKPTATTRSLSPPRYLVLVIGFAAGWIALDRVRSVHALGSFIRTDGAAQVARLGFAFAALLWVGAALAPVAPRGSALAFAVAGAIGTFLATASSWERRLEWWGASSVLNDWNHRALWAGAAFVLAVLALLAGRYQPRDRGRPSIDPGTIRAPDSARAADQNV